MFEGTCINRYLYITLVYHPLDDDLVSDDIERDLPNIEDTNASVVLRTLQMQCLFKPIQPSIGNCILVQLIPICNPSVLA